MVFYASAAKMKSLGESEIRSGGQEDRTLERGFWGIKDVKPR
jgi:hypothetical protein